MLQKMARIFPTENSHKAQHIIGVALEEELFVGEDV